MEYIQLIAIALLGLAAAILQFRNEIRLNNFMHLLFFVGIGTLLLPHMEEGLEVIYLLMALVASNYVIATLLSESMKAPFIRLIIPLLSFGLFLLLFRDSRTDFSGELYSVVNKFLITGGAITLIAFDLGKLKLKLLNKLMGGMDEESKIRSFLFFATAVSMYLGLFASSYIGLYIIAAIHMITAFYRKEDTNYLSVSILLIVAIGIILAGGLGAEVLLLSPDVTFGLFIGAYFVYFLHQLDASPLRSVGSHALAYGVAVIISIVLLFLGSQFELMGGKDAFVAVLAGIAVANGFLGRKVLFIGLASIITVVGIGVSGMIETGQKIPGEDGKFNVEVNPNEEELEFTTMNDLATGEWIILKDSSRVTFDVGKNGATKGAFKKVGGEFIVSENLKNWEYNIDLKMSDFTTFNAFRDESLMGSEYFKADRFPSMSYSGKGIKEAGNKEYELEGEFKMLGVSKQLVVKLQRVVSDNNLIRFTGSGVIDRTLFGMTPSATEGNIVNFRFDVYLENKNQK